MIPYLVVHMSSAASYNCINTALHDPATYTYCMYAAVLGQCGSAW